MKFERINDKQIRCTLSSFDLSMRNLGPNDMVYGSSKVRGLFTEMMEKASQELGFEADGTPKMDRSRLDAFGAAVKEAPPSV